MPRSRDTILGVNLSNLIRAPTIFDLATLIVSAVLVILSIAFAFTNGLVADVTPTGDVERYCHQYNSTGSDDDLCITLFPIAFFGLLGVVPGFIPPFRQVWLALSIMVLKTGSFALAWSFQLLMLGWIEIGSLPATIIAGKNVVLLLWLLIYGSAPLVVLGTFLKSVYDIIHHDRRAV